MKTMKEIERLKEKYPNGGKDFEQELILLIKGGKITYEEVEASCADIPGMYDICPTFSARAFVRISNELYPDRQIEGVL